jgi:hypothetical protein
LRAAAEAPLDQRHAPLLLKNAKQARRRHRVNDAKLDGRNQVNCLLSDELLISDAAMLPAAAIQRQNTKRSQYLK